MPAMLYIILGGILMGLGYRQLAEEDAYEDTLARDEPRCNWGHACCRKAHAAITKERNDAEASS